MIINYKAQKSKNGTLTLTLTLTRPRCEADPVVAIAPRVLSQVVLVLLMCLIEYAGHSDIRPYSLLRVFGHDVFVQKDLEIFLHLACNIELLLAVTEYDTRVLRP